jgi:hypothetical protein
MISRSIVSENPLYLFNPKEKVVFWNSINNKTLSFVSTVLSDKAKWIKREDLKDVVDPKVTTIVANGVANGKWSVMN